MDARYSLSQFVERKPCDKTIRSTRTQQCSAGNWNQDFVIIRSQQFLDRIPNIATGRDKALHPHLIEQQINSARQVAYLAEVDRITLPIRDRHERATAQGDRKSTRLNSSH